MSVKEIILKKLDSRRRRSDDNKGLQMVEQEYTKGWGWTIRRSSGRWHGSYYPASVETQALVDQIRNSPYLSECERQHFQQFFGQECRARDLLSAMRSSTAHRDALLQTAQDSISATLGTDPSPEE